MDNLAEIIESILFVAGEPVQVADITNKLDITNKELNKAIDKLMQKFSGESGIYLLHFNDKLQLSTNSKYADAVSSVLNPIRERNLSKATLETAAIIAYKQPITRLEIEEIRGVSCDYAISILLEHNLIEVVGRKDAVGRPVLFGTTDEFLKRFNISSIAELPDYNKLLEQVKVIRTKSDSLYNEYDVPTDPILHSNEESQSGENEKIEDAEPQLNKNQQEKEQKPKFDNSKLAFNDIIKEDEDLLKDINDANDDEII